SLNDNPTRAICTLHRSDPRRPGVLLRRYDTTDDRCLLLTGADSLDTVAAYIGMLMMDFTVESPPELIPRLATIADRYRRTVDHSTRERSEADEQSVHRGEHTEDKSPGHRGDRCSTPTDSDPDDALDREDPLTGARDR
ncbi:hypothetical protein ACF07R_13355, partial [Brevibacterium casei]